jgi:phosphatidylglycerophosphate synthase
VPLIHAILNHLWPWTALLFVIAVITDFYDGKLARHLHQTSPLGGLFDHATDAAFVTCGCWALASIGLINPWLPWLIPAAFIQYMLDSKALSGVSLRMSNIGRTNGVAYYVLLGTAIGGELLGWEGLRTPVTWFAWILVVSTLISMLDRAITLIQRSSIR